VLDRALRLGPRELDKADRLRLLSSHAALAFLRREVLAQRAHPEWTNGIRMQQPAWRETLPPAEAERSQVATDADLEPATP
jgi:hypothetical protein